MAPRTLRMWSFPMKIPPGSQSIHFQSCCHYTGEIRVLRSWPRWWLVNGVQSRKTLQEGSGIQATRLEKDLPNPWNENHSQEKRWTPKDYITGGRVHWNQDESSKPAIEVQLLPMLKFIWSNREDTILMNPRRDDQNFMDQGEIPSSTSAMNCASVEH